MADGRDNHDGMALQALEEQLQAMLRAQTAGRGSELAQAGEKQAMKAQASTMMSNFESAIQEQLATIAGRLEQLSARLDQAQHVQPPQRPEEVPGYAELKTALHNLVEHLELAEGRTAEAIGLLHERMEELASRASAAPSDMSHLEERIEALTRRLEELRQDMGGAQNVRAYVDERVDALAQRVEAVHDIAHQLPQQVEKMLASQPAAATAADRQIVEMVERMQQKLERLADSARQTEQLRQELDAVQQELAALRSRPAAPDDAALGKMRDDLRALSEQVAQKADRGDLSRLEEHLQALLTELPAAGEGDPARVEALEEKVQALRNLVEEALGQPLLAIEDKLKAHEAQLASLGEGMGRVDQLEQAIAALRDSVAGAGGGGDGADIAALKTGMAELETFARKSDERTREMLEAMHQTLAEVVERLLALEEQEKATGDTPRVVAEAPAATAKTAPKNAADELLGEEAPEMAEAHPRGHASAVAGGAAIDAAEIAEVVSLLERQTDETPAARPAEPQNVSPAAAAGSGAAEEDFIAAARRAALAAAQREQEQEAGSSSLFASVLGRVRGKRKAGAEDSAPIAERIEEAPQTGKRSLFASLKERLPARGATEDAEKRAAAGGSRKRLLLAGIVLLSAAALLLNRQQSAPEAPVPAAVEQAAPAAMPDSTPESAAPEKVEGAPAAKTPQNVPEETGAAEAPVDAPAATPVKKPENAGARTGLFTPATDRPAGITTGSITPLKTATAARRVRARVAAAATAAAASKKHSAEIAVPAEIQPASLRMAAQKGDGKALYLIGIRYLKGSGLPRDARKAFQWFEKAAQKGVAVAMYRLGAMLEKGVGARQDFARARAWYERAAIRGNVRAMHNLGVLLASGHLGAPNMEQAAFWFRKAAQHGVRDSQFNLAVLHHRGQGVPRNLAEAWFWYSAAAKQGDAAAARQAKELAAYLGPQRLASVRKRLEAFRPAAPIRNANVVVIEHPEWRQASVRAASTPLKPLAGVALVREVQKLLAQLGYDAGPADGILGNRTANAIRLFQMQNRMTVNGRPDMALLQRLRALAGNA